MLHVGECIILYHFSTGLKWWNDRKAKKEGQTVDAEQAQWVDDYEGEMQTKFSLFWEYLEIGKSCVEMCIPSVYCPLPPHLTPHQRS